MLGRLVLIALLAVALAPAQRGSGGRGINTGAGNEAYGPPIRPQRMNRLQQFSEKLKLNKEQVEEVNNIFKAALEKAGPVSAQLENSRTEIAGAMIGGKSPDDVNKLLEAHTVLEAQMDAIEAEAFSKIFGMLKPNQQAKAGQAFELMAGIFDRAAMQSGGGGRRGRQEESR
jgi:hypothetical protein